MLKKILLTGTALLLAGCTWANPEKDGDASDQTTNSGQTAEFQKDEQVTDEELIRYNLYPNPSEYYEQENLDRSMDNTDGNANNHANNQGGDQQLKRDLYYELMQLEEVRQAGISITDDKIFIAINLENRSDPKETVQLVKEVTEEMTGRSDIIVDVDPDFDTRIE